MKSLLKKAICINRFSWTMEFNYCAKKLDSNSGYLIIWQHKKEWQIILNMFNECLHKFFFNFLYYLCKCVHMEWNCRERSGDNSEELNSLLQMVLKTELKGSGLRGKPFYLVSHVTGLFTWVLSVYKFQSNCPWGVRSVVKPLPHKQADLQDPGTHIPWCIWGTREWRQANPQREPAKPVYRRGFRVSDRPLQRIRWRAKKEDTQCGPIFTFPKEMYSSFKVNNDSTSKH